MSIYFPQKPLVSENFTVIKEAIEKSQKSTNPTIASWGSRVMGSSVEFHHLLSEQWKDFGYFTFQYYPDDKTKSFAILNLIPRTRENASEWDGANAALHSEFVQLLLQHFPQLCPLEVTPDFNQLTSTFTPFNSATKKN